ncbi:MAG: hypothetical protein PHV34_21340, partial [Verrucomicrobiae bacterium]|nr:hypothetical protein [Verrucomicrobiae bacterium]
MGSIAQRTSITNDFSTHKKQTGAWQFRRVFWVGFSLEGQEILDLGLRWLAEHLRGGFIFPL